MAIYFYDRYSRECQSRNFGDDINPFLLKKLFRKEIIENEDLCVMGIGTIISDEHLKNISTYKNKVIFSSGVGYGSLTYKMDESWDVMCVRGPRSAERLSLPREKGICDGAILLSEFYPPLKETKRRPPAFIPHVESHWRSGQGLQKICNDLGIQYVVPDLPFEEFISAVRSSPLVLTEAMHGAILADTMRVPWIPLNFHFHNSFKWNDWFESVDLDYKVSEIKPVFWNTKNSFKHKLKTPYQIIKHTVVKKNLEKLIDRAESFMSNKNKLLELKERLYKNIDLINKKY